MKFTKHLIKDNAYYSEGKIVAGGKSPGKDLNKLRWPSDLKFDESGNLYVADQENNRVMR